IAGNRHSCTAHLTRQAEHFLPWKSSAQHIDAPDQLPGDLPCVQVMVPLRYVSVCHTKPVSGQPSAVRRVQHPSTVERQASPISNYKLQITPDGVLARITNGAWRVTVVKYNAATHLRCTTSVSGQGSGGSNHPLRITADGSCVTGQTDPINNYKFALKFTAAAAG